MDNLVQPALRTREAYALGITKANLAGKGWDGPFHGIRLPTGAPVDAPLQRIFAAAELLPADAALGGWAAAYLLGATELDGRGRSGAESEPVPLVVPPPHRIRPRPGIVLWRSALLESDVVIVRGIPVTSATRTGFDLARRRQLRESVVALDQLGRQLQLRPEAVCEYARERRRWHGVRRVLAASELADPRAASAGESRMRLLWMLDARLPRPEPNASVLTLDGHLLGHGDLLDPDAGVLGEYDGAGHREIEAHTVDNAREEWLEHAGIVVVRATSIDLGPARLRTVHRLRAGYQRGRSRDRARDAWTWRPAPFPWDADPAA